METELRENCERLQAEIGALKKREEFAQAQLRVLQSIADSSGDGIVVADETGKFILFNPAAKKILGLGETEIGPEKWTEHYGIYLPDQVTPFPTDRLPLVRAMRGESVDREEMFIRNSKIPRGIWISVVARPLIEEDGRIHGGVAVFQDVTERIATLNTFRGLLESAPDAMVITSSAGKIAMANAQAERLFGYTREEMIGQTIEILVPQRFRERHVENRKNYMENPRTRPMGAGLDLYAVRKDGTEFPVEISLGPVETPDGLLVCGAIRDITERKAIESRLKAFSEELARSNRELQDFASVVSHDLQEPLRKVRIFGERLEKNFHDILGEEGGDYVNRMVNASKRMQALIDDLLTYSRVSTKIKPFAKVDLAEVIREVQSDLEVEFEKSKGRLEIGALPTIEADPTQMRELLQNLIANSLKFARQEEPPVVKIYAEILGRDCELTIEDNGIGFEEKYAEKIFGIFQRLHGRDKYEGTGIGLAICKKIVERHRGTISAKSSPGKGSSFTIRLPLYQPKETLP